MSARAAKKSVKSAEPRYRRRLVLDVYPHGGLHCTKIKGRTRPVVICDGTMIAAGAPARGCYRLTITRDPAGDWEYKNGYIYKVAHAGFSACYMYMHRWGSTLFRCTVTFQSLSKSTRKS